MSRGFARRVSSRFFLSLSVVTTAEKQLMVDLWRAPLTVATIGLKDSLISLLDVAVLLMLRFLLVVEYLVLDVAVPLLVYLDAHARTYSPALLLLAALARCRS
jgi:hypothetical protein